MIDLAVLEKWLGCTEMKSYPRDVVKQMYDELREARRVITSLRSHMENGCVEESDEAPLSAALVDYDQAVHP